MERDTAVELFEIRTRGMLARMFDYRQYQPGEAQMQMLRGERGISLRDIAEIAFLLDFEVGMATSPRKDEESA